MHHNIYASILVMFLTIYAVRALPLTLIRREIRNPFIQSFLYYVPYVSLSVMTFPSILSATGNRITGIVGFVALKSEQTCAEACKPLENIDKNRKQIYNAFIVCQKTGDGEQFIIGIE